MTSVLVSQIQRSAAQVAGRIARIACGLAAFATGFRPPALGAFGVIVLLAAGTALAQGTGPSGGQRADDRAPVVGDDASRRVLIRFLTTSDFPPFNATDETNTLTGFNVDLARALCLDLGMTCDIQARPWAELIPALKRGDADALIAGHAMTAAHLADLAFTASYFHLPARFAVRRRTTLAISPDDLDGRRVGVAAGSAHAAYIKSFFRRSTVIEYATPTLARDALVAEQVDVLFGDGVRLAFWVNGASSRGCCELRGGAYFEPRFFGEGLAIGVKKTDPTLREMLDQALLRLRLNGRLEELAQRYFPVRVY